MIRDSFDLTGRVAVITGGAGMLGFQHAKAIAGMGGIPVIWDVRGRETSQKAAEISELFQVRAEGYAVDITDPRAVQNGLARITEAFQRVDILINNAANDPKVSDTGTVVNSDHLEDFSLDRWNKDLAVGLTGAFICSQIVGTAMAAGGKGVILNIASELALIGPDQRIYRQPGLSDEQQPVKPVTYSVVKSGILGLTRYLATYWADKGVRVNALSPGGVYAEQPPAFVKRLSSLIPMGRMAQKDEYQAAVVFLVSDASSFMTGANVVIDGGRTCW